MGSLFVAVGCLRGRVLWRHLQGSCLFFVGYLRVDLREALIGGFSVHVVGYLGGVLSAGEFYMH